MLGAVLSEFAWAAKQRDGSHFPRKGAVGDVATLLARSTVQILILEEEFFMWHYNLCFTGKAMKALRVEGGPRPPRWLRQGHDQNPRLETTWKIVGIFSSQGSYLPAAKVVLANVNRKGVH